jgi:hypothetical protein
MRGLYLASILLLLVGSVSAVTFMSEKDAIGVAFSKGSAVEKQTFFLTHEQKTQAEKQSGSRLPSSIVIRYVGRAPNGVVSYAYFDTHRVRTLPETVMVVVAAKGTIERVEILNFNEPMDYFPKRRWVDQLHGHKLDDGLSLQRDIRPISGASLTGHAVVDTSRRILAIHALLPIPALR